MHLSLEPLWMSCRIMRRRLGLGAFSSMLSITSFAIAQEEPGRTRVTLESDNAGVELQHFEDVPLANGRTKRRWVPVCSAPCGAQLTATGLYRIGGPDISASRSFELPAGLSGVTVRVETGSQANRTAGILLTAGGGALIVVGAMMPVLWAFGDWDNPDPPLDQDHQRHMMHTRAAAIAGTGLVALIVGLYLIVDNGTEVRTGRSTAGTPLHFSQAEGQQCH